MGFKNKFLALPIFGDAIRRMQLLNLLRYDSIEKTAIHFATILEMTQEFNDLTEHLKREETGEYYHGYMHALVTFIAVVEGGIISPTVTDEELPLLGIAALGHDLYHSRGQEEDQANVFRASSTTRNIVEGTRDEAARKEIGTAITATLYPWREYARINFIGKILRDADMMAPYLDCPKLSKILFQGLYNEIRKKTYMAPHEFETSQKNFRRTVRWNTNWGNMKAVRFKYIERPITSVESH